MKKKLYILLILILLLTTGCFKRDKMEDIEIISTIYPFEYVANRLYSNYAEIKSIYPKSSNVNTYKFTNKEIKDFSKKDLFIYNGKNDERELAKDMINYNNRLKIINASYGIDLTYAPSDLWLNPANILMIGQNIKNELSAYITNSYIKDEIENEYNLLKVDITELETEFKTTADNSSNKTIIVADESLNFLQKYGFNVINLTSENKNIDKNIQTAKSLLNDNLSYIFIKENLITPPAVTELLNETNKETITYKTLETISEEDYKNNEDYISLMYKNLDLIKQETYK